MRAVMMAVVLWPGAALAWERLDDAGIEAVLADRVVRYDALTHQVFLADGRTEYHTERYAEGAWKAEGGRYCSLWPPASTWTCYDLEQDGDRLRFTNDAGVPSVGVLEE